MVRCSRILALVFLGILTGCMAEQRADRAGPRENDEKTAGAPPAEAQASADVSSSAQETQNSTAAASPNASAPSSPLIPDGPTMPAMEPPVSADADRAASPRAPSNRAAAKASQPRMASRAPELQSRPFSSSADASPAPALHHPANGLDEIAAAAPSTHEPSDDSANDSKSAAGPSSIIRTDSDFAVMQVFYATNRDRLSGGQNAGFWLPLCVAVAGGALTLGFFLETGGRKRKRRSWMPLFTLALTIVLTAYTAINSRYTTNQRLAFNADRGPMQYGVSEVSIPNVHVPGELESPSILRLEFTESPDRHIVIQNLDPRTPDEFFQQVRETSSEDQSLLVFIHGYNVRFDEALLRTAQLAFDLKFQGSPILFSWPSYGGLLKYPMDLSNADWSTTHFKQFLLDLRKKTQAKSINLIAHSMGNRVLMESLSELALELKEEARMFNEVILAAPDVDADRFQDLAPRVISTAQRTTLYASSGDQALMISKRFNGAPRAGDSGDHLVLVTGVDTIDASHIDTSMLGHSYYGDSDAIINDLRAILQLAQEPTQRTWLMPKQRSGLTYWVFRNAVNQAETENTTRSLR